MRELIEKVRQWGLDRGVVFTGAEGQDKQAMMEAQARYTLKETAELLDAYADKDIDKINDAIGDILVTLVVGASSNHDIFRSVRDVLSNERTNFAVTACASKEAFSDTYARFLFNVFHAIKLIKDNNVSSGEYLCCINELDRLLWSINGGFEQYMSLKDCLELAYNEIKDRTGKVVNGQFIKDK